MLSAHKKRILLVAALLLGLVILAFLVGLSDMRELAEIGRGLDPGWIIASGLCAIASFAAYGLCFACIVRSLVLRSHLPEVVAIGYVSFTFSELLLSAGLSGLAVRSVHLSALGISPLETLIYSLARAFIHYFAIFILFLLTVLFFLPPLPAGIGGHVILLQSILFAGLLAYAVRIFYSPIARSRWIRLAGACLNAAARIRGRELVFGQQSRQRVEGIVDRAVGVVFNLGWRGAWALLAEFAGMGFRLAALYFAFLACGYSIHPGIMAAGFIIGTFWAFLVQIPGQLGVMEGAVSAVFTAFAVPFETTLAAAVLYRLTYTLLPFLAGLAFFPRLARRALSTLFTSGDTSSANQDRSQDG